MGSNKKKPLPQLAAAKRGKHLKSCLFLNGEWFCAADCPQHVIVDKTQPAAKRGRPSLVNGKSPRFALSLPEATIAALTAMAEAREVSIAAVIREAVEKAVANG